MSNKLVSRWLLGGLDTCVVLLARMGFSESFIRFAIVGVSGFCWDTGTFYLLRLYTNPYAAATCSFIVAATANWALNRLWTFRHHNHAAAHVQWAKFMTANIIGFAANRGTLFILISRSEFFYSQPVLAIIAGSIAGLSFNYFLSKRYVFS
ncbi:MAG: GtrA family protein [Acidocella sp.]|nr:GtrA family protein [Acidocella sp.]